VPFLYRIIFGLTILMNIYLVTHTEIYNPNNLLLGQSELPLAENFTSRFAWLMDTLLLNSNDTIYLSNSSRRCTKLASFLSDGKFAINDNFIEINLGNLDFTEKNSISDKQLSTYLKDGFPGGESLADVQNRLKIGLKETLKLKAENCVLVTSPSNIKLIILLCLKANLKGYDTLNIDFGSISKLQYQKNKKQLQLIYCNLKPDMI